MPQVSSAMAGILGFNQSVHTLERNQRETATTATNCWQEHPTPPAEQEGGLLVFTADGKGVPMRGGATAGQGSEPPTTAGIRPGIKKMALLGAAYTVDPLVRTPEKVLAALFQDAPAQAPLLSRPLPCYKYVRAALQRDAQGTTAPQVDTIFGWLVDQGRQRNPNGDKSQPSC